MPAKHGFFVSDSAPFLLMQKSSFTVLQFLVQLESVHA